MWKAFSTIRVTGILILLPYILFSQVQYRPGMMHADEVQPFVHEAFNTPALEGGNWDVLPVIREEFRVNELAGPAGAEQSYPHVASDSLGHTAVAWIDYRKGYKAIYAQFYDPDGTPIGSNICISSEPLDWNNAPVVACNAQGDFIIAWANDYKTFLARRFTYNGHAVGAAFQINLNFSSNINDPDIFVRNDGGFAAVWTAGYSSFSMYIRSFDSDNQPLTGNIRVNDADKTCSSIGWGKRLASDGAGTYLVSWSAHLQDDSYIFMQQFDAGLNPVGGNRMVSDSLASGGAYFPSVVANRNGQFFIIWERDGWAEARIFDRDGYFVTRALPLYYRKYSFPFTGVSTDWQTGSFLASLTGSTALKGQLFEADGTELTPLTAIRLSNADSVYAGHSYISSVSNGRFFTVFDNYTNSDLDVFIQIDNIQFEPIGSVWQPEDNPFGSNQTDPLTCTNGQGTTLVVWNDWRNRLNDLYGQLYDSEGNPIGSNKRINSADNTVKYSGAKAVSSLSDGSFIIAYLVYWPYNKSGLWLNKLSPDGQSKGNKRVIDYPSNYYNNYQPLIYTNQDNEILAGIFDRRFGYFACYKILTSAMYTVQDLTFINTYNSQTYKKFFWLSANNDFSICASWINYERSSYSYDDSISVLVFNSSGQEITDTLKLGHIDYTSGLTAQRNQLDDNGNILLTWNEYRTMHLQRLYFDYPQESKHLSFNCNLYEKNPADISTFANRKGFVSWSADTSIYGYYFNDARHYDKKSRLLRSCSEFPPGNGYRVSTALNSGKLFYTYQKAGSDYTGLDIWAGIGEARAMQMQPEHIYKKTYEDMIFYNYPNPFNATTRIGYNLLSYHQVKLAIYDVLGREVKVLVNTKQEKGYYEVDFDGSGLASGLYFCRLQAFDTKIIKLLLVR